METTVNSQKDYSAANAARMEKILKSKIYGDGMLPKAYGILDMYFVPADGSPKVKYDGQKGDGRVLILLPFRTLRSKNAKTGEWTYAMYSFPAKWDYKFRPGVKVTATISGGYVSDLSLAKDTMTTASVITVDEIEEEEAFAESFDAPVSAESPAVPAGFEAEDSAPF